MTCPPCLLRTKTLPFLCQTNWYACSLAFTFANHRRCLFRAVKLSKKLSPGSFVRSSALCCIHFSLVTRDEKRTSTTGTLSGLDGSLCTASTSRVVTSGIFSLRAMLLILFSKFSSSACSRPCISRFWRRLYWSKSLSSLFSYPTSAVDVLVSKLCTLAFSSAISLSCESTLVSNSSYWDDRN